MEPVSKSEKKRQAKSVEKMVFELVELTVKDIALLPCDQFLKDDIREAKKLKTGSRKRLIKYIAKILRQNPVDDLYDFLQERKGSQLKKKRDFRELERLRDVVLNEAVAAYDESRANGTEWEPNWQSSVVEELNSSFPGIDSSSLRKSAWSFARSRKPVYGREIFRILKAAQERILLEEKREKNNEI